MSTQKRNQLSEIMRMAWSFVRKNGYTMSEAFGTLKEGLIGEVKGTGRKPSDNVQVYWDTEKSEYRSFKKCNLIKIG